MSIHVKVRMPTMWSLDLPGIKKEDIEITTEDNVLTISGERKDERRD